MRGGGHEKLIYRSELHKNGGLWQFVDLRRWLGKKEGVIFL